MLEIVIVGAGGFAREIATLLPGFLPETEYTLKGFLGKDLGVASQEALPAPLLADPETYCPAESDRLVLAIGHMPARRRIVESLTAKNATFQTLVHPRALVAPTAKLAKGVIVYPFAAVSNHARLGYCAKLNYYASVGHDTQLGAFCLLAPYATVNGFGVLEDDVYLSTHSTVAPQVRVGRNSKISANSAAMQDVPADSLVFGVPGRVVLRDVIRMKPLLVFGTRPEAIKMAPVVLACERHLQVDPIVCVTGQHREMLAQVVEYFGIQPQVDLELMKPNQTLAGLTAACVEGIDRVLQEQQPDCIVVQGDTTTVMAASVAAFYRQTPVVHVEAGLRTGNLLAPWPEEFNRRVTSLTTALHCAPTTRSATNLVAEGIDPNTVHVTGNTVIDALLWAVEKERHADSPWQKKYSALGDDRVVLITGHRRENFGGGFEDICRAIRTLAEKFAETHFVYPVHLNPNVQGPVNELLGGLTNVHLISPAPYPEFVWLMDRSTVILSDSGGVQEEAPSLKKPVLVMRETTERPEALDAGAVELVGTSVDRIVDRMSVLLTDEVEYRKHQIDENPYGDGSAAERIVELMVEALSTEYRVPSTPRNT